MAITSQLVNWNVKLYRKRDESYWNHGGIQECRRKRQRISNCTSETENADN